MDRVSKEKKLKRESKKNRILHFFVLFFMMSEQ